jgi:AcrR family transcriptional regulator
MRSSWSWPIAEFGHARFEQYTTIAACRSGLVDGASAAISPPRRARAAVSPRAVQEVASAPRAGQEQRSAPRAAQDLLSAPRAGPEAASAPRAERRDKVRNREKVLTAAAGLFETQGVEHTTVVEIARRAGVGVGTIYRGFTDKGGLVAAILDERERHLQDQILSGPPPLGPGAPPEERIRAFIEALAKLVESSYELLLVSENHMPGARYRIGSYGAWRLHLASLIRATTAAPHDPDLLADALLAPLAADLYRHQRRELGMSAKRIRDALIRLAGAGTTTPHRH